MEIKIFERDTLRQAIKDCLAEGFMPANTELIYQLKQEKKIPVQSYDSGTLFINGVFRDATKEELENIEVVYTRGGRLVWFGSVGINGSCAYGYDSLNYNSGVLVGVKELMGD